MRGIARRLDDEARQIERGGQASGRRQPLKRGAHAGLEIRENIHEMGPRSKRAPL